MEWDYKKRTCRLTMDGYVAAVLQKFNHPKPTKRQHSPHQHRAIVYGQKEQETTPEDTSPPLDAAGVNRVQRIVGALLYYARAVDKATYPNDGITYRASDMVLAAHSDAGFLNESKARSRVDGLIFLSEDDPIPRFNGPILGIAQIIKFVVTSAAEAELAGLYINAKELIPLRHTLEAMGWPQPKTPVQTDNSTASGVVNKTIIPRKMKSMDMRLWWLRDRESQGQFRFYWDKGSNNWADYHTKHHPPIYHESNRHIHAG